MDWLSREQIDQVLTHLSADDLIEAVDQKGGSASGSPKVAAIAFNAAAARVLGTPDEGRKWTEYIRATDFRYFADTISEAVNVESPLSDATSELLGSPEPGVEDSDPLTFVDSPPQTT